MSCPPASWAYLKRQVRHDAADPEADQQQVGEDEGPGGVGDLLDVFVGRTGLTRLPVRSRIKILILCFFLLGVCVFFLWVFFGAHLLASLAPSSSQSLSFQSMT